MEKLTKTKQIEIGIMEIAYIILKFIFFAVIFLITKGISIGIISIIVLNIISVYYNIDIHNLLYVISNK